MTNININSVPVNSKVWVTGIVDYSRIASPIDGDELAEDDARRTARGLIPTGKAHTRLTLRNCVVNYENPASPTIAEQFIQDKFYDSKQHPENSPCFTAMNKSKNLPSLFCRENEQTKRVEAVVAEAELAPGTPVTIMIRFFASKQNHGCSLDMVIVNTKPITYYSKNMAEAALKEHGFEVVSSDDNTNIYSETVSTATTYVPPTTQDNPTVQTVPPVAANIPTTQIPTSTANIPAPNSVPTAVPPVAPSTSAPTQNVAPGVVLPNPPAGYKYDENGRVVPITNNGGIHL